jgi:hypothetical protein
MTSAPNKYPAIEENTTLMASLALVISLKSAKINVQLILFAVPIAVFILNCGKAAKIHPLLFFCNELAVFMLSLERYLMN